MPRHSQHAYAVTTYCAQGTTVDRAYVMADPSMDKQEYYVATSRTREQTYIYATPEIQVERNEFAPAAPERDPIAHIAEAAGRDRAQTAAHDEALRAKLAKLPTEELASRRAELETPARLDARTEETYSRVARRVAEPREQLERAVTKREAVEALGRRERREQLPFARANAERWGEALSERTAALEQMEQPGTEAWREHELAEQLLNQRAAQAAVVARIEPPAYIVKELGERPADPARARAWDRGVQVIEGYRLERGVKDSANAFGREPQSGAERAARKAAQRRLAEAQRRLGLEQQLAHRAQARSIERGFGNGR